MTTPTPAQIECPLCRDGYPKNANGDHEALGFVWRCALTAAAEVGYIKAGDTRLNTVVGGPEVFGKPPPVHAAAEGGWPSQELVNDLVASATEEDKATVHFPLGKPAAEIEMKPRVRPDFGDTTKPMPTQGEIDATKQRAAAAAFGEPVAIKVDDTTLNAVKEIRKNAVTATIERCAQVAEAGRDLYGIRRDTAAAIRALKETDK